MSFNLINISVDDFKMTVTINVVALFIIAIVPIILLIARRFGAFTKSDVEMQIKLGGIGSVKIKPNHEVKQIAHQAWVELKTRKAGLPIDKDNDVISDIYKSWYQLFGEIRTLTRDIPASKLKNPDTSRLVELLVDSLNDGLRPHLTRWRAKYERWYLKAVEKEDNEELTPQDIQSKYPQYQDLVDDMLKINEQLVEYTDEIKKLANG